MKEYYMLLGLNQKEVKIIYVKENNGTIEVSIENKDEIINKKLLFKYVKRGSTL